MVFITNFEKCVIGLVKTFTNLVVITFKRRKTAF